MFDNFDDHLDLVLEARLGQSEIDRIEDVMSALRELHQLDFDIRTFDARMQILELHTRNLRASGRTQEELEIARQEEERRAELRRLEAEKAAKDARFRTKYVELLKTLAQRLPRYTVYEGAGTEFKFLQPNGAITSLLPHQISKCAEYRKPALDFIEALRKLHRLGAYQGVADRVQDIRDFGFNIFSTLLATTFSAFRTRYSKIHKVLLSYDGPMIHMNDEHKFKAVNSGSWGEITIKNIYVPGEVMIQLLPAQRPQQTTRNYQAEGDPKSEIKIEHVGLEHIGNIIDTIDAVYYCLNKIGYIYDIYCMGQGAVEYHVRAWKSVVSAGLSQDVPAEFTIPYTEAYDTHRLSRLIFNRVKELRIRQ
jgi:hypothetical protein